MGGEVEDPVRPRHAESTLDVCFVCNITFDTAHVLEAIQTPHRRCGLQDAEHVVAVGDQPANQVGADKARSAAYEAADGGRSEVAGCSPGLSDGEGGLLTLLTMYAGRRFTSS